MGCIVSSTKIVRQRGLAFQAEARRILNAEGPCDSFGDQSEETKKGLLEN
jgi:hypothetical protein